MRRYMVTLGHSLVAVATITVLYFVVINMAALLMRELFHDVEIDENNVGGFEPRAHFQSWLRAFSVMARTTTGESWCALVCPEIVLNRLRPHALVFALT